tara:strand:- start:655 stop:969 length:315 start_codon:yes stop_codon:yes gene_type:complete
MYQPEESSSAPAKPGHNQTGGVAAEQLKSFIERIERLEEDKAAIAVDIREVFAEAKGNGFDVKTMRQVLKLRRMESHERDEQEHLLDTYCKALGLRQGDFFEEK